MIYKFNTSNLRDIKSDWVGVGYGIKRCIDSISYGISYASIFQNVNYYDKPSFTQLRHSFRVKFKYSNINSLRNINIYAMKINENIAQAKSVLKRNNLTETDEDHLKIREIVGTSHGYIGILTRLRYVDVVTDMNEIQSIFELLKNSKIDIAKLNKMSYSEILDIFYDTIIGDSSNEADIKLILKDDCYSYYRVYTYKGILYIGSPTWCLKTKSNWDAYQEKYPEQWVVIDNRFVKKIITPNNNYMKNYSTNTGYIRYGISVKKNDDGTFTWVANDDNNSVATFKADSYTFFGVMCTIRNLTYGVIEPFYKNFDGCENIGKSALKVTDKKEFFNLLKIPDFTGDSDIYVYLSKSYSAPVRIILYNDNFIRGVVLANTDGSQKYIDYIKDLYISFNESTLFHKYLEDKKDQTLFGALIKLGKMTIEQAQSDKKYISQIGKWLIFDRNENYYLIVNSSFGDRCYIASCYMNNKGEEALIPMNKDTIYFYIKKDNYNIFGVCKREDNTIEEYPEIIKFLKKKDNIGIGNKINKFFGK